MEKKLEHVGVLGMHWGHHKATVTVNTARIKPALKQLKKDLSWQPDSEKNFSSDLHRINKGDMANVKKHDATVKKIKEQSRLALKKENERYANTEKYLMNQIDVASRNYSAAKKAERKDRAKRFAESSFKDKLKWMARGDPKIPMAKKLVETAKATVLAIAVSAL